MKSYCPTLMCFWGWITHFPHLVSFWFWWCTPQDRFWAKTWRERACAFPNSDYVCLFSMRFLKDVKSSVFLVSSGRLFLMVITYEVLTHLCKNSFFSQAWFTTFLHTWTNSSTSGTLELSRLSGKILTKERHILVQQREVVGDMPWKYLFRLAHK